MMVPSWEDRDLRVLRAVVEYCEANNGFADVYALRGQSGIEDLTERDLRKSFEALRHEEPKLFGNFLGSITGEVSQLSRPTGEARRRLGLWPKPEDRLEQIVTLLEELAAKTSVPDEKEALSKTAKIVRGAGSFTGQFISGLASGVATAAITGGG